MKYFFLLLATLLFIFAVFIPMDILTKLIYLNMSITLIDFYYVLKELDEIKRKIK